MKLTAREIVLFGMLGALMYAAKIALEFLPNIHLVGVFIVALTVVYRKNALYPLYTFGFITGLMNGFALWWLPYLYIWMPLFGAALLIPNNLPNRFRPPVYMLINAAHGFLYGTLYAPAQALLFGMDFDGTIAWILAGLPWDMIHGIGNLFCGILIAPLILLLRQLGRIDFKH